MDRTRQIYALAKIKPILESLDVHAEDNEIRHIFELVINYLNTHCDHHIVMDYIDINPDKGYTIKFCDVCMKTFP